MSPFDICIIVAFSVAFAAVVGVIIYKKLTHKGGGCGCGCEGCPHANKCRGETAEEKNKHTQHSK